MRESFALPAECVRWTINARVSREIRATSAGLDRACTRLSSQDTAHLQIVGRDDDFYGPGQILIKSYIVTIIILMKHENTNGAKII